MIKSQIPPNLLFQLLFWRDLMFSDCWRNSIYYYFSIDFSSPARANPIISLDSSKVVARYTDHGLCIREPLRSLTPAMPVRDERATAGGLNTPSHTRSHALPCDVRLFLRRSTAAPVTQITSLNGDRRRDGGGHLLLINQAGFQTVSWNQWNQH